MAETTGVTASADGQRGLPDPKNQADGAGKRTGRGLYLPEIETESQFSFPANLVGFRDGLMDVPAFCSTPRPLCHCLNVDAGEVRAAIHEGDLQTVRQVSQACGAGGGCTSCHRHIKRLIAEAAAQRTCETALEPVLGFA